VGGAQERVRARGEGGILGPNKGATGILDFCGVCSEFVISSFYFGTRGTKFDRAFLKFCH
jgi:hypothetical protein